MGTDTDRLEYSTGLFALIFSLDMSTIVPKVRASLQIWGSWKLTYFTENYGV